MSVDIDKYFMRIAFVVSSRSTCLRRKVGAVLVCDKQLLSSGYNGSPANLEHCSKDSCVRFLNNIKPGEHYEVCRGVHAEQNAIVQCAKHGVSTDGASLYCTTYPCSYCAKIIINAGIEKIFYYEEHDDMMSNKLFEEAGINVEKVELSKEDVACLSCNA